MIAKQLSISLTWGSAPHPGSVPCGGPMPRAAPSQARRRRAFRRSGAAVVAATLALFATTTPCLGQSVLNRDLPLVWVLSTGGTIAGRGSSPTDLSNYKSGSLLG